MHNATTAGVVPVVSELLTSERLALSRDQYGATPLHKAVLFYQPKLVKLIADKYRITTRAKDQVRYFFYSTKVDQGLLEFIWTEGYSGQSSNPGLSLAILVL